MARLENELLGDEDDSLEQLADELEDLIRSDEEERTPSNVPLHTSNEKKITAARLWIIPT